MKNPKEIKHRLQTVAEVLMHIADSALVLSLDQEAKDIIELATDVQKLSQRLKVEAPLPQGRLTPSPHRMRR